MSLSNKIPITIVTGCLGSGKTTLLRNLLKDSELSRSTAVIVNEFGKIGLDHHLLTQTDEKTVLLNGGCICCNSREDLVNELNAYLTKIEKNEAPINRIIIETTGMANPAPILFTVVTNPLLQHHFYIDCVITTVDAKNGLLHLRKNPEMMKQVTAANKIVLTKSDIATKDEQESILTQLKNINPTCEVQEAIYGNIDPSIIVGGGSKSLALTNGNLSEDPTNHLSSDIQSISFTFKKPLDWTAFGLWLSMLLHAQGENVLRVKGLLDVGEKGPIVLNGVQHIIHPPEHLDEWPEGEKHSHLIFILRSIEPLQIKDSLTTFQEFLNTEVEVLEHNAVM